MFKVPEGFQLSQQLNQIEADYVLQKNDQLLLDVYSNNGEKILLANIQTSEPAGSATQQQAIVYTIDVNGNVKLPLINQIKLEGLTVKQAEEVLQTEFSKFYQQPFVKITYQNQRAVVLGALPGQVIPLTNQNMKLTEVLALAKGLPHDSKAHNIRILRGSEVYVADLSTIDGYLKNNVIIMPNDIIYVEPVRRPLREALQDYGPVVSILTSLSTLILVFFSIN
ncbi:polysaccharide biosynthesis/export family protein [Chryseosolibacter indicus]|uniref:Polysaccharide biosynthesis/export family protein n=1 Tax=Chryseosolibacter indicus TaxID=2782351 RepID=A0ABS5VWD0_9BACT|nr:polysaccharide biosynthesis/export family protein [Chryseosolibacter indicus]MBT1705735.1 polysaccharide biosynthesis/export family protein [Chryseosolibacter indicus]